MNTKGIINGNRKYTLQNNLEYTLQKYGNNDTNVNSLLVPFPSMKIEDGMFLVWFVILKLIVL